MTCHRSPVLLAAYMTCVGGFMGIGSLLGLEPAIAHPSVNLSPPLLLAQSPSPKGIEELPLQVGSRGETVQALQTRLKKLGYYEGDTDGVYGDTTRLAVIEFQESIDLDADGVVGLSTWTKLQAAAAEVPDPDNSPAAAENAEEDNQNADKAQPNSNRQQLLWIVAGVCGTLGIFGGGLFFLLKVLDNPKKGQAPAKAEDSVPSSPPEEPELPMVMSSSNGRESSPAESVDLPPTHLSEPYKNGYNPSGLSVTDSHISESPSHFEPSTSAPLTQPKNRLAKKNGVNQLIKDLQDSDPTKRRKAIWELAQRGDSRAVQPLVNLMLESDSQQRSLIIEALSQIGMKTLKPMNRALALSLQDDNPQVRKNAIRDLTLMYELVAQMSQLLSYALDDPEADVQETARWALSQLERIRTPATVNSLPPSPSPLSFSENQLKEPPMFE
ncbi:MAG: HEAT repeat domain-containing protein [Coleofasciculus sp. G1-WW12-02]|uniref:peptidoglycan-binding protein n=1 Tax=Coleofasciculus sp. G1-WW12-02 TaxID=3068483 RepID=UPI0032F2C69F